jgi:hypothetical protein
MARKIYMPTPEEDAEITAAALSDPDAQPLTDEELASMVPFDPTVLVELTLTEARALADAAEAGAGKTAGHGRSAAASAFRRADQKLHRAIAAVGKPN